MKALTNLVEFKIKKSLQRGQNLVNKLVIYKKRKIAATLLQKTKVVENILNAIYNNKIGVTLDRIVH